MICTWYNLAMKRRFCSEKQAKDKLLKDKFLIPCYFFLSSDYEGHAEDGRMIIMEEDDDIFGGHKSFKTTVR